MAAVPLQMYFCSVLKCLLTHANCAHTSAHTTLYHSDCIYSQVFPRDRKLGRIRFVLAWCANEKHHTSGCRFESCYSLAVS